MLIIRPIMAPTESSIIESIIAQGPLVAFMLWVIWSQKSSNESLMSGVKSIQDARFNAMESHIQKLEAKSEACEQDRMRLWEQNAYISQRFAELNLPVKNENNP